MKLKMNAHGNPVDIDSRFFTNRLPADDMDALVKSACSKLEHEEILEKMSLEAAVRKLGISKSF